ncbi:MAG: SDR family NAD(P)-dependent oxidoreductase [Sphingomonadaceae bacterium]
MSEANWPECAAVFGASGGIGAALCEVLAAEGVRVWAVSRSSEAHGTAGQQVRRRGFDLTEESSIAAVAAEMRADPPQLTIVATGVLTLDNGTGPERSYRHVDADAMERAFRINAIGPMLVAKHVLPLLPRDRRSVFAALSARVSSIGDNRLGGWHSYRASKAALNMLLRNLALELGRTHPEAIVAGLHPGTVDTGLSKPFQANLPDGQLHSPHKAALDLIGVIEALTPECSGRLFDWNGEIISP